MAELLYEMLKEVRLFIIQPKSFAAKGLIACVLGCYKNYIKYAYN